MFHTIRTNTKYSSGKRWVEFYVYTLSAPNKLYLGLEAGVSDFTKPTAVGIGERAAYPNSLSYRSDGLIFSRTTSLLAPLGIPVTPIQETDVVGMLVDMDTGFVTFYINGVSEAPVAFPTGEDYAVAVTLEDAKVTANLYQNVIFQTGTIPAGATDWDGNAIPTINPGPAPGDLEFIIVNE